MNPGSIPFVLVLCTGNSCRSHLAEGFLRAAAHGRFRVASAGSKPAGYVHPLAHVVGIAAQDSASESTAKQARMAGQSGIFAVGDSRR